MTIEPEVSYQAVLEQLPAVADYAAAGELSLNRSSLSSANLKFFVTFKNRDGEAFIAEFDCRDFPLYPPTVEFVSKDGKERGTSRLYPQGFHPTPCVCMRYNRKAYQERGGPHGDWRLLDWRLPSGQGIGIDTLAMMVSDLHSKIRESTGRMG